MTRPRYFRHPTLGHFFPSDIDIQPQINVARHRHSELVTQHLTFHFSPTLTVSFLSRRRTLRKISIRRVLDLMDLVGPIGGPAFSSQTLPWCPLEYVQMPSLGKRRETYLDTQTPLRGPYNYMEKLVINQGT